jgi:EmrB/QacA subfamily drug resistance transporter
MVDSNIVNVALPDIAAQLHTTLDTAQWIISGYLLSLAALLAAAAYLAKRFGTRRVYFVSLLGFTAASALCALSPTIGVLISMRVVQGALGAPLVPLAMSMLLGDPDTPSEVPPAVGMVLFLAPALGPTLGGLLIHIAGWPLVFLINVPLGIVGALGVRRIPPGKVPQASADVRLDLIGMLALSGGLVLASYGATQGPQRGWGAREVWPFLASGGALLACYVVWALRRAHPAVDLKLLRHTQTALAVGLCTLASIVLFAMLFLLPIYMEDLQGLTPVVAGLALLPQGLVMGLGTVLGDRLAVDRGIRFCALLGMAILTLSTAALLFLSSTTPAWMTALLLSGRGLALGLVIQPLLLAMIGHLAGDEVADGNTLFNVAERLGGSLGIPLLATFFVVRERLRLTEALAPYGVNLPSALPSSAGAAASARLPSPLRAALAQAALTGFHDTIWLLVVLSALGMGAALLLQGRTRQTEAATSRPPASDVLA